MAPRGPRRAPGCWTSPCGRDSRPLLPAGLAEHPAHSLGQCQHASSPLSPTSHMKGLGTHAVSCGPCYTDPQNQLSPGDPAQLVSPGWGAGASAGLEARSR